MSNIIDLFGLTYEETRLLFSMQSHLVERDRIRETDQEKRVKKFLWHSEWEKNIKEMLRTNEARGEGESYNLLQPSRLETKHVLSLNTTPMTKYLILLELVTFVPYYPLATDNDKKFKGLKVKDNKDHDINLKTMARYLDVSESYVDRFKKAYEKSSNGIKGNNLGIIFGVALAFVIIASLAIPVLAPLFAAKGLAGAAAVSAGLAALGGGAIAAGGLGMAGGMAVVVGGGAILGGATGGAISAILSSSPEMTLSQAAKLEVVLKEIILLTQKDVRMAQELILNQRNVIADLEQQMMKLKCQNDSNKERIKSMEQTIEYLKKALKRNEEAIIV